MSPEPATLNEEKRTNPEIQSKPAIRWLTYFLLLPLVALATTGFGCISLVCGLWDKSGRQQHAIARAWARVLLLISLSPVELVGAEKLRLHEVAVYASNHLSYYDTPLLFAKLPFQFRILAKQPLWKIPFIGWYLNHSGQVPVDQSSARSAVASLSRGVNALKSGLPLVLFPKEAAPPMAAPMSSFPDAPSWLSRPASRWCLSRLSAPTSCFPSTSTTSTRGR